MSKPPPPQFLQVAMCTDDLPRSVRLYTEGLGFADAGGRAFWGPWLGQIQDLGDEAACLLWWLVGRQDLFQIELFQHTEPGLRRRPEDWRPSDLGWVRWGVAVPDFDATLERLRGLGVTPLTPAATRDGRRRVCFRDPHTAAIVELMEDGAALPGGIRPRFYDLAPAVIYAALSVADLDQARAFYVDTVGLVEEPPDLLHTPEMESLWGLPGAVVERFVARGGDVYLEVSRYSDPVGRPPAGDQRLSDQGMMNAAVGSRDRALVEALFDRLVAAGYPANAPLLPGDAGGTYLRDGEGHSFELLAIPREFDADFGFVPMPTFGRPAQWPRATVPAAR